MNMIFFQHYYFYISVCLIIKLQEFAASSIDTKQKL